ncbi:hypothetical protein H0H87_000118 [Tephrocybe sp. NHM501043]|nr:hypothetical protein H0H87_000118 [Tephrocybe sp. NHM501043]
MTDAVPYQAYRSKRHSQLPPEPQQRHTPPLQPQPQTLSQLPPEPQQRHTPPLQPKSPSAAASPPASSSTLRPASTFRRVPRRPPPPPSPLGPPPHSRTVSLPAHLDVPSPAPLVVPLPAPAPPAQPAPAPPPAQPTTAPSSAPSSRPPSSNGSPAPQRPQAPYRPGFQPKGLYRPLTDEFLALRRSKRDGDGGDGRGPIKRVERTKLLRRLEKLIDLHFPPEQPTPPTTTLGNGNGPRRPGPKADHRRASSFFDFDIRKINISDPGGFLRGVIGGGDLNDIRGNPNFFDVFQIDQPIIQLQSKESPRGRTTPMWVNALYARMHIALPRHCPLTDSISRTSFHPLTNRKHHCRLCGQIICSLPVKHPLRPAPCSLLFVVDPKSRRIEEVDEGVDYGVKRKPVENGEAGTTRKGAPPAAEDKFLKGVRICRSCRPILLRQQYQYEVTHVPTVTKLYEVSTNGFKAFVALEQEIEDALPQFQELVLTLSHNDPPTKEASISRKRLLEAFAQYDALAKRIRKLPCRTGSSEDQVQASIMNRASLFLQKNMFPLQSLPTPNKKSTPKATPPSEDPGRQVDPDSEMALALQPLLEQEALLESFVEEAKAHRKFEDVKTLKTNLREIRAEIEKMVANAEGGMHRNGNGNATRRS